MSYLFKLKEMIIMKKTVLLIVLVITSGIYLKTQAESNAAIAGETKTNKDVMKNGEQIFLKHADECLALIEKAAQNISIKGVAMIAFIPGDVTETWISKMKVVGRISSNKYNLLAMAYCKASEMAITHEDSGNDDRITIIGEFGYEGGIIKKVDSGYIVAAFGGGTSQQDADVAKKGLDWLSEKY